MKFSLILATLGRTVEVEKFMESLSVQSHRDFELIVADQNTDGKLNPIIEKFSPLFKIIHVHSTPGLSKSRNAALSYATGELLAFPDDDCLYPIELLLKVNSFFTTARSENGLLIQMKDSLGKELTALEGRESRRVEALDVFTTASISIFIKREVIDEVGRFDEGMGLGTDTIFKGGEDYDLVLNAMSHGTLFFYDQSIVVLHPVVVPDLKNGSEEVKKKYYDRIEAAGTSDYLLFRRYFPFFQRVRILVNNFLGLVYYGIFGDKRQYLLHYYRCRGIVKSIRYLKAI